MFQLTTHDPDHTDDEPRQLPLALWVAHQRAGLATFSPDPYEGIGLRLTDGTRTHAEATWGDARSLAHNCEAAASRLVTGKVGLIRSTYPGSGVYLLLAPAGDQVRCNQVTERPPVGDVFPYSPNLRGNTPDQQAALYAWAEAEAERLSGPRPLVVDREGLIAALTEQAAVASVAAELLGLATFG
jgi:hypothetical protein